MAVPVDTCEYVAQDLLSSTPPDKWGTVLQVLGASVRPVTSDACVIFTKAYGPEHSSSKRVEACLRKLRRLPDGPNFESLGSGSCTPETREDSKPSSSPSMG